MPATVRRFLAGLLATSIVCPTVAQAAEPITKPVELRHDLKLELPILGALAAVTVGFRLVRDDMEPSYCRICEGKGLNPIDKWFRDAMVRQDTQPAQVTSYVLAFGAAPLSGAALTILAAVADDRTDEWPVDLTAVAEGGFAAMLTTEVLESLTLRERPFFHAITDPSQRQAEIAKTGAFHSFPAGHVVEAFGVATAAGVVASMRGYRLAPLVWLVGMGIGAATAYTRIASDHHYVTDTLAGAAIGTVVGGGVPLLFHRPKPAHVPALMAMPLPGGVTVSAGWML
jgi:hypothetical protein